MRIEKLKSSLIGILCCLVLVLATSPLNSSLDVKAFPSPFLVAESFGTNNTVYDFTGDGKVDMKDIAEAAKQYTGKVGIAETTILDPLEAWSEAELIIWQYNTTHYGCRNMSTLMALAINTNLTLVEQWALGNMTSGLLYMKDVAHNTSLTLEDDEIVIECYQGSYRVYSNQGKGFLLPKLAADPDTSGWGTAEAPQWWWNTGEDVAKLWNGSAILTFPVIGGGSVANGTYTLPYAYTFYKVSTTYYAEKYNGVVTSSGNFSALEISIDSTLHAAGGGVMKLLAGTYTTNGTGLILHRYNQLVGDGMYSTFIDVAGNYNGITVDPTNTIATWAIKDLSLDMNNYAGHGIYSTHASAQLSATGVVMDHVFITACKAGYWGIYFLDLGNSYWNTVRVNYAGGGVYLGHGTIDSIDYGNCIFDLLDVNPTADDSCGLFIDKQSLAGYGNCSMNFAVFRRFTAIPNGDATSWTNHTAVKITNETKVTFYDTDIENMATCMYLNNVRDITVENTRACWGESYGIRIVGSSYGIRVIGGYLGNGMFGSTQIPYSDESTSGNYNHNLLTGGIQLYPSTAVFGTETDLGVVYMSYQNSSTNMYPSVNNGVTSCVNGTVITHRIMTNGVIVPESITLDYKSYINGTAFYVASVIAKSTTTFTVGLWIVDLAGDTVTASASSLSITWEATYKVAT